MVEERLSSVTTLVMVDHDSLFMAACVCTKQGGQDAYAVAFLSQFLEELGYQSVMVQSDQENAIMDLVSKVKRIYPRVMTSRVTPRYSHGSNGSVEKGNQILEGMCRTLRLQVECEYGVPISTEHILFPWLVRHAAWLQTRFQPRKDHKSSFGKVKGVEYRSMLIPFTETVLFREPGDMKFKADAKWAYGIWLGRTERSDEHLP